MDFVYGSIAHTQSPSKVECACIFTILEDVASFTSAVFAALAFGVTIL